MNGLTISAAVLGVVIMIGAVAFVLASDRIATQLNEKRQLLADPPRRKVSPVLFRGIGAVVFVGGLILTNMSVGMLIFG